MSKKLNHSRYLDYYARDIGDRAYERAKATPTSKQIKFYTVLYARCKEHGIDTNTGEYTKTRADYAQAIDKLLQRLKDKGIDIKGNDKDASLVLMVGQDNRGRYYTKERIVIEEEKNERIDQLYSELRGV